MKKNVMRLMTLVVSLVMFMALLGGCASSPAEETTAPVAEKKIKAVYTTMTLGSPYFVEVANGVKDQAEKLGWDLQIHDPKGDVAAQISALENFIAQKVDVIIISPLDGNASKDIIAKAKEEGIFVVDLNSEVEGADVFITPDEYEMGFAIGNAAGEWAAKNLTGQIKAVTYHVKEHAATLIREQGMRDGITKHVPNVEFVASLSALTPEDGIKNMEGLIQKDREINIVVGCNDAGIMGSYEVAKSANLDLTKMYFGGIDAVAQAKELIRDEKAAGAGAYRGTVDITPFYTGVVAVDAGQSLVDGKPVDSKIIIPAKVVGWDNIDEYFK